MLLPLQAPQPAVLPDRPRACREDILGHLFLASCLMGASAITAGGELPPSSFWPLAVRGRAKDDRSGVVLLHKGVAAITAVLAASTS
jgi:hypothetical protein